MENSMNFKFASAAVLCVLALAACTDAPAPMPAVSNGPQSAPSGITSSNGGGARQLGNIPNIGVNQGRTVSGPVPSSKGAAY